MTIRTRLLATLTALALPGALLTVASPARAEPPSLDRWADSPSTAERAPGTSSFPTARGDYEDGAVRRVANLTDVRAGAPDPAQSVRSAVVVQDLGARRISARVTLGATPGANVWVYAVLGEWSGNSCEARAAVAAASTGPDRYGVIGSTEIGVSAARSGSVLTITSAAVAAIRSAEWECAYAYSVDPATSANISGVYADDLVTQYVPRLGINRGAPIQGSRKGKWTTIELDLHNDGRADARSARVRLSGAGLAIKPRTRSYGTLEDRSSEYFEKFKVRLKGSRPRTLTIALTAAGGYRTTTKVRIVEQPKPTRLRSLVGRYYWGHKPVRADRGWDNVGVRFVSARFARVGFTAKGAQPCRKQSKACRPYRYDQRRGTVRVQGVGNGRVDTAGLRLGKQSYFPLTVPRRGAKLATRLIHQNFEGICGIYCVTWTEWLTMDRSGRFVRSRQTIGSLGPPGVGSIWASTSPDQRGRYEVLARGKVRFSYADGTTKVHSIGVEHDVREKPSPAGAGVVLDDVNFYLG